MRGSSDANESDFSIWVVHSQPVLVGICIDYSHIVSGSLFDKRNEIA
jgi:hypothetical protein